MGSGREEPTEKGYGTPEPNIAPHWVTVCVDPSQSPNDCQASPESVTINPYTFEP